MKDRRQDRPYRTGDRLQDRSCLQKLSHAASSSLSQLKSRSFCGNEAACGLCTTHANTETHVAPGHLFVPAPSIADHAERQAYHVICKQGWSCTRVSPGLSPSSTSLCTSRSQLGLHMRQVRQQVCTASCQHGLESWDRPADQQAQRHAHQSRSLCRTQTCPAGT